MKLLLDTNIVVEVISRRNGYEASLDILRYCEIRKATGLISSATVLDVTYILRKHIEPGLVKNAVRKILAIANMAEVKEADILGAFESEMTDYEDAVQALCARRHNADFIVTRNMHDFRKSPVAAMLPEDMVEHLKKEYSIQ